MRASLWRCFAGLEEALCSRAEDLLLRKREKERTIHCGGAAEGQAVGLCLMRRKGREGEGGKEREVEDQVESIVVCERRGC